MALVCELVLNEGVEESVVEGLVPGLAREHCAEVRAALTHDLLEADHDGALGGHRHVLGRGREPDDVHPVVGEHWLVLCDAQLQLRVVLSYPVQHLHHPRPIVAVRDGRQELVERLDCHGMTIAGGITAQSRAAGRGLNTVIPRPAYWPSKFNPVTFLRRR